jgi:uncharacterized protein (DUF2267 family)
MTTTTDYERFITVVQQHAHISREQAERAIQATLETLAERLSAGEARDLADELPGELAGWLHTSGGPEPFRIDEFLRRVAAREGTDIKTAERHARAVFAALGRMVSRKEIADMTAELPKDFEPLLAEAQGRFTTLVSAEDFLKRVADHGGLTDADAQRAIDAVLETLAERIAGGEVDDLIALLGAELHPPLLRGKASSGGKATKMTLEQFLRRVAEREGVAIEQARDHTSAVFDTLRDAIPHEEFLDVTAQLPLEYQAVGARPQRP